MIWEETIKIYKNTEQVSIAKGNRYTAISLNHLTAYGVGNTKEDALQNLLNQVKWDNSQQNEIISTDKDG